MIPTAPGVYAGLTMDEYLKTPAVNASLIGDILDRCPRAAWFNSWLNPKPPEDDSTKEQSAGTVAHSILLEGNSDCVVVIDPNDHIGKRGGVPKGWTNDSIREARDAAIADGRIPKLVGEMAEIEAMVAEARLYIESLRESEPAIWALFQPGGGDSELTLVWDDHGTLCRIRPDRISADRELAVNYKTTSAKGTAEPDTWGRTQLVKMGYYVDSAFYRRGIAAAFNVDEPSEVFLVQEQEAPYLCSLVGNEPHGAALGDRKVARGLARWATCVRANIWPAYPNRVCYPEIPPWEHTRWEEQDNEGHGIPYDPAKLWPKDQVSA